MGPDHGYAARGLSVPASTVTGARRGAPAGEASVRRPGMAHGEAEHGCAQGEPCRPGHHDPQAAGKHRRPIGGAPSHPAEPTVGRADDEPCFRASARPSPQASPSPMPTFRMVASANVPAGPGAPARPGPARPRATRRERPPRRWC
ncbi:hypothetical protein NKG94_46130 [Micromonospora sp. M12]